MAVTVPAPGLEEAIAHPQYSCLLSEPYLVPPPTVVHPPVENVEVNALRVTLVLGSLAMPKAMIKELLPGVHDPDVTDEAFADEVTGVVG